MARTFRTAWVATLLLLTLATGARAQDTPCPALSAVLVDSTAAAALKPDVIIRASATARSLTVTGTPRAHVQFTGCGLRDTVHILERTNLPSPVVSGTTYHNVRIAVEILAFLDPRCVLAQLAPPPGAAGDTTGNTNYPNCRRNE